MFNHFKTGLIISGLIATSTVTTKAQTLTGCLTKLGTLINIAQGNTPMQECTGWQTEITFNQIGRTGPEGQVGTDGAQGPQGIPGPTGQMGPKGDVGIKGDTGPKGDVGPKGEIGPKGDVGSVVSSEDTVLQ